MQREPPKLAVRVKHFGIPAVLSRRGNHISEHGADVNRLAEVSAKIFAEALHGEF
jgi:hypothetical protein